MEKVLKIGVFDSGVGGFSVLSSLLKELPEAEYFYVADALFAPYGELEDIKLFERANVCVEQLLDKSCDIIVLACNTITAWTIDQLREKWPVPFVGVEPYVNIINQRQDLTHKKVGLLVTSQMSRSQRLKNLLVKTKTENIIEIIPMPGLASDIENFVSSGHVDHEKLSEHFKSLDSYDSLILGCTHYPLISRSIEQLTKAETICPSQAVAKRVKGITSSADSCESSTFEFLDTKQNEWVKMQRSELQKWPK